MQLQNRIRGGRLVRHMPLVDPERERSAEPTDPRRDQATIDFFADESTPRAEDMN